jgi:hypothetical protein
MRALVIDPEAQKRIALVMDWAARHPVNTVQLMRMALGREAPVGDDPNFVVEVFDGFRAVFSLEEQPHVGLCRHLSVSVAATGKYPAVDAVEEFMKQFGFEPHPGLRVWLEKEVEAVNVVQPIAALREKRDN